MNLILPLLILIAFGSAFEPKCVRSSPPPKPDSCHEALGDMIEDIDNYDHEKGGLTWVTRVGFVGTDYIVPKSFPRGEGADRCVITVDVTRESESDQVFLEDISGSAFEVIEECVEAKDHARSGGQVIVGEKQVVLVTVGREKDIFRSDGVEASNEGFQRSDVARIGSS